MEHKSDFFPPPPPRRTMASSSAAAASVAAMQDDDGPRRARQQQAPKRQPFVPQTEDETEKLAKDPFYLYNPEDKFTLKDNPRAVKNNQLLSKREYLLREEAIARYNREGFETEEVMGQRRVIQEQQAPRPTGVREEFGARPGGKLQEMPDVTKTKCAQCKRQWPTDNMLNNMWNHYKCHGRTTTYLCSRTCMQQHHDEFHKQQR
jgi:hypothetical protein